MLIASLIIVCFFDLIISLLTPSTETMIFVTDGSAARYATDFICCAIGLFVLYKYGWKRLPSIWLGLMMIFLFISHFHSINIQFSGAFIPGDLAIYNYKPMLECFLFFILFMGIYSMNLKLEYFGKLKNIISWIGIIYAGFAILQRIGLDQFYKIIDPMNIPHMSRNPEVGGFICQPVFCAALISIAMPFIIKTGSWWKILIAIAGILATGNRSSLIAVAMAALYLFNFKLIAKILIGGYIVYLIGGIILHSMNLHFGGLFEEERFRIWHDVIADAFHSKCSAINNSHILTGIGLGAFSVIMPYFYVSWMQAHNEYLECLKCLGIVGLIFMMIFIYKIPCRDKTIKSAVLASLVLALTNATWHIPQLAFLTVFLIAILYNMENAYGNGQSQGA